MVYTCNLEGGLGNQLFQIFTLISYSIKNKEPFSFLNLKNLPGGVTPRTTYFDNFLKTLKPYLLDTLPEMEVYQETEFGYNEIPPLEGNICLRGYFQSYKYFEKYFDIIYKLLEIEKTKIHLNSIDTSMHFRIGDYKSLPECHPILNYTYYENALNYLNSKNVLFFCENCDIDDVNIIINKLKLKFHDINFLRAENLTDYQEMVLMSCCNHNIIANSSFSWWSAYFNSWKNKIVCYPSLWFTNETNINTKDLCPPEWIKIQID